MVDGDVFPCLFGQYAPQFTPIVTHIYNKITIECKWAELWKTEYVTVIPKTISPTEASDCRKISCTNFLSRGAKRAVRWPTTLQRSIMRSQKGWKTTGLQ